jgi:hypothetical protein
MFCDVEFCDIITFPIFHNGIRTIYTPYTKRTSQHPLLGKVSGILTTPPDYKTAQSGFQPVAKTIYRQDFYQNVTVPDRSTSALLNDNVKENYSLLDFFAANDL